MNKLVQSNTRILDLPPIPRIQIDWDRLIRNRSKVLAEGIVPPYLLLPEVNDILDICKRYDQRFMLETMWCTGIRVSELLELTTDSFLIDDPLNASLRVRSKKKRGRPSKSKKAKNAERYIPITDDTYIMKARQFLDNFSGRRGDPLFKITAHGIRYRINADIKRSTVRPEIWVTPHTFRHSFAVNAIFHARPTAVLKGWLGHERLETTEIYTNVLSAETGMLMKGISYYRELLPLKE